MKILIQLNRERRCINLECQYLTIFLGKPCSKGEPVRQESHSRHVLDLRLDEYEWTSLKRKVHRKPLIEIINRRRDNCLAKLRKMDATFAERELQYLRNRCKQLAEIVEADIVWLERQKRLEDELTAVQKYYREGSINESRRKT